MVSFSSLDIIILAAFFFLLFLIGIFSSIRARKDTETYLLSGRNVGLVLFIITNVATWYGGILGVGEFSYNYGLLSWFSQGVPYYIFAILFGIFFAGKIRESSLYTIPDKIEQVYGRQAALLSSFVVFILVLPAPYLLMAGSLLSLMADIDMLTALFVIGILTAGYLYKGGYKADLYTDIFQFIIMFLGFGLILYFAVANYGGAEFLKNNLPKEHLTLTGGTSPVYVLVWFFIALWTFVDPGFHQRCYAAKNGNVAKWGVIISVALWFVFDILTTGTGLFARAAMPGLKNATLAFPLFAEKILGSGFKGLFYAAMFATILSTLNSFLFLSASTFGKDFVYRLSKNKDENKIQGYVQGGLIASVLVSILLAYYVPSVIGLWYNIGSLCIPGIIFLVIGAYYNKFAVAPKFAIAEIICGVILSASWMILRDAYLKDSSLYVVEPMITGLTGALFLRIMGIISKRKSLLI